MKRYIFTSQGLWNNGIFVIRVLTAMMIISHGFEMFSPEKMHDNIAFITDIHFPFPNTMGYIAKITESAGGLLLALGLFTRLVTIPLMFIMLVIIYGMNNWDIFNGELTFLFLLLFLTFLFIGPGKWSLDYLLFDRGKK